LKFCRTGKSRQKPEKVHTWKSKILDECPIYVTFCLEAEHVMCELHCVVQIWPETWMKGYWHERPKGKRTVHHGSSREGSWDGKPQSLFIVLPKSLEDPLTYSAHGSLRKSKKHGKNWIEIAAATHYWRDNLEFEFSWLLKQTNKNCHSLWGNKIHSFCNASIMISNKWNIWNYKINEEAQNMIHA
jgi:hypothetical protein